MIYLKAILLIIGYLIAGFYLALLMSKSRRY